MEKITVYFPPDGTVVIRWPQGFTPDRDSLERVAQAIAEHKKTPAPCGNMERGKRAISPAKQEDCTTEE